MNELDHAKEQGHLTVCATPIGNLKDMTSRALQTLAGADLIAAEDTRHTRKLLSHYAINTPLTSYHEHNKKSKGILLADMMAQGKHIALVSDAGMPGISDPGEDLIRQCIQMGIPVSVCPGASAGVSALVLSGFCTRRFVFEGFLPPKGPQRRKMLDALAKEPRTCILYEAPHRIVALLTELAEVLGGERKAAVIRELTKLHEQILRDNLTQLAAYFTDHQPRGEFVIVLEGVSEEEAAHFWDKMTLNEHVAHYQAKGFDEKEAMKQTARDRNIGKRAVYAALKTNEGKG